MKSLCILLAAAIIQGAIGQQDTFSVEPNALNIVPEGEKVVLECITREPVVCAWKLDVPELRADGFLNTKRDFLEKIGLRARDPTPMTTDCSVIIDSVEMRHIGRYTCSPFLNGQVDGTAAEVIVAVRPAAVVFTGEQAGATELRASATEPASVTCVARDARPKAELRWFLDERELTDGVIVEEDTDPASRLVTSRSTLKHQFERQDEGAELRCQASHPAFGDQDQDQTDRQVSLGVVVQFAPVRTEGPDLGTVYGFTEGEDKELTVTFSANPRPTEIRWTAGPDVTLVEGEKTTDGRITAEELQQVGGEEHQYSLRLTFSPVAAEDQNTTFTLRLGNDVGEQELSVRVGAEAPPPATAAPQPATEGGLSGGAIGGLIVAVIVLLAAIALVAFARSRGMWCFAAESGGDTRKEWRAHMDPEAADRDGHDNPGHDQKPDTDAAEHRNGTNGTNGNSNSNGNTKLPTDTPV